MVSGSSFSILTRYTMAGFYYGGQAVIEGVMMRGQHQATVVVRAPEGDLRSRTEILPPNLYQRPLAKLPFFRGLVALWEMLIMGTRLMLYSARIQARVEEETEVSRATVAIMILFSLTFAIAVFFVGPLLLARAGGRALHGGIWANVLEGVVRLVLFLAYLGLMGRIERMHRVFQYHGAEHKTVNAYEAGAPLSPRAVQQFSTIHVRCGTAFLLWVVVLSIVVFSLLGHPPILLGILSRIVLVPVIAAIGYEILRLGARYYHIGVVRAIVQPGLWLQRLTTREPSDDQVEVAIAALLPVLRADGVTPNTSNEREPQFGTIA
jgi:uncharacterized protein YqhQ